MRSAARRARGDSGTSTTTVALVFPLLMLLLLMIVQFGINYHVKQRASAAADRAVSVARWADATEADGEAAGMAFLEGAKLDNPFVDVVKGVDEVQATVTGTADPLLPMASWTVTATATAPVERFIPEPDRDDASPE